MHYKNVEVIRNQVIIELDQNEQTTKGGIILHTSTSQIKDRGIVRVCGKDSPVSVGDRVIFNPLEAKSVAVTGDDDQQEFVILDNENLYAKIN